MKRKRPSNTFIVILIIVISVLFLVLWFFKDLESYNTNSNTSYSDNKNLKTYNSKYTPRPTTPPKLSIYKNTKYNFQFDYISEIADPEPQYKYKIEEKDNVIQEIAIALDQNGKINSEVTGHKYVIYDVNESDGQDLKKWWTSNIKTEILNGKIPDDYRVETTAVDELCATNSYLREKPKAISVYYSKKVGGTTSSTYYYFNFGKPFILHFEESSSGACSVTGPYLHFSIRPL